MSNDEFIESIGQNIYPNGDTCNAMDELIKEKIKWATEQFKIWSIVTFTTISAYVPFLFSRDLFTEGQKYVVTYFGMVLIVVECILLRTLFIYVKRRLDDLERQINSK